MTTDLSSTSYDLVPYSSTAFPQTHPDRLATVARLFGVEAAEPQSCRVLELGAASGGNLIPMAYELPDSGFVGVDLSSRQIADGQATIAELGLANIEFRQLSITDIGRDFGEFDYVICHGGYSWVPDAVREHILTVCRDNLAPNGVAYVSYNTYPGWHLRGLIRDMMRYHADRFGEPKKRIAQARALLEFLAASVPGDGPYGMMLRHEVDRIRKKADDYLFHEHLDEVNSPVYFHQFAQQVAAHGLQYLGEAELRTMLVGNLAPKVSETLRRVAQDIIHMEQYMDFVRNRTFRQSLLVHNERALRRKLQPAYVKPFFFACPAKPLSPSPDLAPNAPEGFRVPSGPTITTPDPATKAALWVMAQHWPEPLSFGELCTESRHLLESAAKRTAPWDPTAEDFLAGEMLAGVMAGIVELRPRRLALTRMIDDRPVASRIARRQANHDPTGRVVNLRHEPVLLNELQRQVIHHLDGEHDRNKLLNELIGLVLSGKLNVDRQGRKVVDQTTLRATLAPLLEAELSWLASSALLESGKVATDASGPHQLRVNP